jgi:hypothetical protein
LMDNLVKACFEFCGWNSGLLTDAIFRDGWDGESIRFAQVDRQAVS